MGAYLESVESFVGVDLPPDGFHAVSCQLLKLGQQVPVKTHTFISVPLVQIALKLLIAQLVTSLKLAVVRCLHLYSVIRQVYQFGPQIKNTELS